MGGTNGCWMHFNTADPLVSLIRMHFYIILGWPAKRPRLALTTTTIHLVGNLGNGQARNFSRQIYFEILSPAAWCLTYGLCNECYVDIQHQFHHLDGMNGLSCRWLRHEFQFECPNRKSNKPQICQFMISIAGLFTWILLYRPIITNMYVCHIDGYWHSGSDHPSLNIPWP